MTNIDKAPAKHLRIQRLPAKIIIQCNSSTDDCIIIGKKVKVHKAAVNEFDIFTPNHCLPYPSDLPKHKVSDTLKLLRKHIPLAKGDLLLILTAMTNAFAFSSEYPLISLIGPQGSGKSTIARRITSILDPRQNLLQCSTSVEDISIMANNNLVVSIDNLSKISKDLSDILCSISTGSALLKRRKYSNSDQSQMRLSNPIITTSLRPVILRGDLCDRTLAIHMPKMENANRSPQDKLATAFAKDIPQIMSCIFELTRLVKKRFNEDFVITDRMVNFSICGQIIESELKLKKNYFRDVFQNNRHRQAETVLQQSSIGIGIVKLIKGHDISWEGSDQELFVKLKHRTFGRFSHYSETISDLSAFVTAIDELEPQFSMVGITLTITKGIPNWYCIQTRG